jgi:hypothetical protein
MVNTTYPPGFSSVGDRIETKELPHFDIRCEGRRWSFEEAERAYSATDENPDAPGKLEFVDGKFYHSDAQRITMLAWLLEMMGTDVAVRLGDPDVWRAAVAGLVKVEDSTRDT